MTETQLIHVVMSAEDVIQQSKIITKEHKMICTPFAANRLEIRRVQRRKDNLREILNNLRNKKKHTPAELEKISFLKFQIDTAHRVLRDMRQR